ncbi:MAG: hypothetical protein ACLTMP_07795 [Eggerthella lenta]
MTNKVSNPARLRREDRGRQHHPVRARRAPDVEDPDPALERNKHVYVLEARSGKTFNLLCPNLLQLNELDRTTDPGDTLKKQLLPSPRLQAQGRQHQPTRSTNRCTTTRCSTSRTPLDHADRQPAGGEHVGKRRGREGGLLRHERQLHGAHGIPLHYADQPQYQTFLQMLDLLQLAGKDNPSQTGPLDIIMLGTTAEDGFQGFMRDRRQPRRRRAPRASEDFVQAVQGLQVHLRLAGDRGLGHRVVQRPPGCSPSRRSAVLQRGRAELR